VGRLLVNRIYIFAVGEEMWSQKMSAYTQNSGARTHSCKGVLLFKWLMTGECYKSAVTCSVILTFCFEIHFTECYEYTKKSYCLNG